MLSQKTIFSLSCFETHFSTTVTWIKLNHPRDLHVHGDTTYTLEIHTVASGFVTGHENKIGTLILLHMHTHSQCNWERMYEKATCSLEIWLSLEICIYNWQET